MTATSIIFAGLFRYSVVIELCVQPFLSARPKSRIYVNEPCLCLPGRMAHQKLLRSSMWTSYTFEIFFDVH